MQKILKSFENINDTVVKAVEDIANRTFKDIMFKANSLVGNLIYEGFHGTACSFRFQAMCPFNSDTIIYVSVCYRIKCDRRMVLVL